MNKLSHIVEFARYRGATRSAPGPSGHRLEAGRVACRWRRDLATGKLICVWASTVGAREAEPPLRLILAA